jgi:hypothetical protein
MKECRICNTEKEDTDFRPKRRVCRECERAHGRAYRRNNPHKGKNWTENNREHMKKLQSSWYDSNKEHINAKFRERYNNTSSDFKKVKNYRTGLNHMLGGEQKTNKHVGCHVNRLKNWCEYCLEEDMTMNTYAETWVVDHVIPLDFTDKYGFEILAMWYNIMPVKDNYNLEKNKYTDPEQVMIHYENVRSYFEDRNLKLDQEYMEILAKHLDAGNPLEP